MGFSTLNLSPSILRALEQEGYTTPTPIQRHAIPLVMAGRDVLGCAQTGTGKTAAFALPILQRLAAAKPAAGRGGRRARALILSPTRELAAQIAESFATYGRGSGLAHAVVYGGVSQYHQERALRAGVDILVATPGRLIDLMEQRIADLSGVEVFVLDEADRMLDMGFIQPIRRIAAATPAPPARQTLLFSATMPESILKLAHSLLKDPVRVSVDQVSSAAPKIEQNVYMVSRAGKQALLEHLLADAGLAMERALVFTRTKHGAERVGKRLKRAGIGAETIHGNRSQGQRKRALAQFSTGHARVLVATDVAARGLDVDDITHVINFDLPVEPEAYVHRIGRTGRAGATGVAISFCDGEERTLLRDIEKLTGKKIGVLKADGVKPIEEPTGFVPGHGHHDDRSARSGGRGGGRGGRGGGSGRDGSGSGGRGSRNSRGQGHRTESRGAGGGSHAPRGASQQSHASPNGGHGGKHGGGSAPGPRAVSVMRGWNKRTGARRGR